MSDLIKHMVDRFLAWKLPETFNPDGGVSFEKFTNKGTVYEHKYQPSGTNLLDAIQAEAMVRHMLEGCELPAVIQAACCRQLSARVAQLEKHSHPPFDFTHLVRLLTVTAQASASILKGVDPNGKQGKWRDEIHALLEEACPGHVASAADPKVCGRCGVHIDSFRPDDPQAHGGPLIDVQRGVQGK